MLGVTNSREYALLFDSFGDDPSTGSLNEGDRRCDGGVRGRIGAEPRDDLTVDLDHVETDKGQCTQTRVAVAHIVEGESKSSGLGLLQHSDRFVALHTGMFSHFKDHLLGCQAGRDYLGLEGVDIQAAESIGVDVDEKQPLPLPVVDRAHHLVAGALVELDGDAETVGKGERLFGSANRDAGW